MKKGILQAALQKYKNEKIILSGLGSYLKDDFKIDNLNIINDNIYHIIMVHEPDMVDNITNNLPTTSLILSGHSINGSVNIPGIKHILLPEGAKKYYNSYYKLNNTDIYISNGIGVNNLNFRLFNTPSFNLYRLRKED